MSPHHSDQMSQRSQVSWQYFCSELPSYQVEMDAMVMEGQVLSF